MGDLKVRVQLFIEHFHGGKLRRRIGLDIRAGGVSGVGFPRGTLKRLVVGATGILLSMLPGQRAYFVYTPWITYRVETPQTFMLQDGSTALLNAGTEMSARFTREAREIALSHGEALFSVSHNREWPFQVSAGEEVVRAVGTAFLVRLVEPGQVNVLVTQGRVQVTRSVRDGSKTADADRPATLVGAGNEFIVRGELESTVEFRASDLNRRLAWTKGPLRSEGRSLTEVVREINKYSEVRLEIADPSIAQVRIGGSVVAADRDGFLKALSIVSEISATRPERQADGSVVIRLYRSKKPSGRR
jgi:transmembrane sensor